MPPPERYSHNPLERGRETFLADCRAFYLVDEAVPLAEDHAEVEELQVQHEEDAVGQDVADVKDQVEHVRLAAVAGKFKFKSINGEFVYFLLEHHEEGGGVAGEEDDEEGDPVERLPLDLLVVLLPQLQLPVRLGQPEEDLSEAAIVLHHIFFSVSVADEYHFTLLLYYTNEHAHVPFFTCGFQDAGLGTVGSLLLLNLRNKFRKANRA